jgi:hypothetical protein
MTNFGALAPFLIAALLLVAMIIPGLDAAQKAIEGLIEDRKKTAVEACLAIVEREKGSQRYSNAQNLQKNQACRVKQADEIQKAYNPALFYICKTRQLVTLTNENPNATSAAIEASAATPTFTDQCKIYDNSVSNASPTTP